MHQQNPCKVGNKENNVRFSRNHSTSLHIGNMINDNIFFICLSNFKRFVNLQLNLSRFVSFDFWVIHKFFFSKKILLRQHQTLNIVIPYNWNSNINLFPWEISFFHYSSQFQPMLSHFLNKNIIYNTYIIIIWERKTN